MDKEHEIKIKISAEVTGKEKPTKYDKRRERWAFVALWAFAALLVSSIFLFTIATNIYMFVVAFLSGLILSLSLALSMSHGINEPTGRVPWYYGAL